MSPHTLAQPVIDMLPHRVRSALPVPFPRILLGLATVLLAPALAACRSYEELEPSAGVLVTAEPIDVTLSSSLRSWKEKAASPGSQTRYRLGELLARLFPARDGRALLSPLATNLDSRWSEGSRTFEARFALALTLQLDGRTHQVEALGLGSSPDDRRAAERTALEDGLEDVYVQLAALLARKDG